MPLSQETRNLFHLPERDHPDRLHPRGHHGAIGLIAVVLLSINLPPFQNPDELAHFFRAEHISRYYLFGQRFEVYKSGGLVEENIFLAHAPFADIRPARISSSIMTNTRGRGSCGGAEKGRSINFPNTANYPPFL